jgi:hypothetical protein
VADEAALCEGGGAALGMLTPAAMAAQARAATAGGQVTGISRSRAYIATMRSAQSQPRGRCTVKAAAAAGEPSRGGDDPAAHRRRQAMAGFVIVPLIAAVGVAAGEACLRGMGPKAVVLPRPDHVLCAGAI